MSKIGFDNDKYLKMQSEHILERVDSFGGKLYLEFGGKLFDDYHASRVLPGFQPDSKLKMLLKIKDKAEIVIAICADDIEKNKKRGDLGITYDLDVMRLIDTFRGFGLYVGSVVLTRSRGQRSAEVFKSKLESMGVKVYRHYPIENYPSDVSLIVSDEGFGKNDYINTTRPVVVVTAPGPGSGKMATCLSQLYHEHKRGVNAGYAKFETFPIWNIPLKHPVNLAYEAATADLSDVNMIDPFHLQAYGETTVNYNRDIEIFPVLSTMFEKIYGESRYKSPTDMGVNMAGNCIVDDAVCCEASTQEIIRRWYTAKCGLKKGTSEISEVQKLNVLMNELSITNNDRPCVLPAIVIEAETGDPACAILLSDGHVCSGKTKALMGASCAAMLNALKYLAGIDDSTELISANIIEPIQRLKTEHLGSSNHLLHLDQILIALSICAVTNPTAALALEQLDKLRGAQAHSTVILSNEDEATFRKLGIDVTCEPKYETEKLYHG